jgi:hypothetical protein
MSRHFIDTTIELIFNRKSVELETVLLFNYNKGSHDYFDKSMGCWYPGDPAEVEPLKIASAHIDGQSVDLPPWLADLIIENLDEDALHEKAANDLAEDRERAEESRYERIRDEAV